MLEYDKFTVLIGQKGKEDKLVTNHGNFHCTRGEFKFGLADRKSKYPMNNQSGE